MPSVSQIQSTLRHLDETFAALKRVRDDLIVLCTHRHDNGKLEIVSKYPCTSWEHVAMCTVCGLNSQDNPGHFKDIEYVGTRNSDGYSVYDGNGTFRITDAK